MKIAIIATLSFLLTMINASNNTTNTNQSFNEKAWISTVATQSICKIKHDELPGCEEKVRISVETSMLKCESEWKIFEQCLNDCYEDANNLFLQFDDPNDAMNQISTAQQKCIDPNDKNGCLQTKIEPMIQCIAKYNQLKRRLLGSSEDYTETSSEASERIWGYVDTVKYGIGYGAVGGVIGGVIGAAMPIIAQFSVSFVYQPPSICCSPFIGPTQADKCIPAIIFCVTSTAKFHGHAMPANGAYFSVAAAKIGAIVGAAIGSAVGVYDGVFAAQQIKERTVEYSKLEYTKQGQYEYRNDKCLFRHAHCNIDRKGWFYFKGMAEQCCIGGIGWDNFHWYCNCYHTQNKCKLCKLKTLQPTNSSIITSNITTKLK